MTIAIRTRRLSIRPQFRRRVEGYLRAVLQREEQQLTSVTLYISSTPIAGAFIGYSCRLVLQSRHSGQIVVSSEGARLTTALRSVTRRGRAVLRQRNKLSTDRYQGVRSMRRQLSQQRMEQCSA